MLVHQSMVPVKVLKATPVAKRSSRIRWVAVFAAGILVGCAISVSACVSYYSLTERKTTQSSEVIVSEQNPTETQNATTEPTTNRSLLLFMGDSLTERGERSENDGWITQLRTKYRRTIDVVSRGFSGYNTKWYIQHVLPSIEQDLEVYPRPALITLWLGANDEALYDGSSAAQHVPVENYRANLLTIIERLRAKVPDVNIMLITPPTVDERRRRWRSGVPDRSNEQAEVYAAACVEQAAIANVTVLDLYSYFNAMHESDRNEYFFDGLHFNKAGSAVVRQQLVGKITSEFPLLAHAIKRSVFPEWSDLV